MPARAPCCVVPALIRLDCRSEWECHCGSVNCLERLVHDYFALPLYLQIEYLPFLDDWFMEENQGMIRKLRRDAKADLRK